MKKKFQLLCFAQQLWTKIIKAITLAVTLFSFACLSVTANSNSNQSNDFSLNSGVIQQQKTVSGKVTDSTGSALPGVSIVVKGTTTGIITDTNGKYSLNVPASGKVLIFSFVGMKTQEIEIGSKTSIDVTLTDESIGLDEVVAVGYGTSKRSDLVGSTSSVKTKEVLTQPSARLDQVLQGKSPGLVIQNTSAAPNGNFTIRIRGANSLSGSNDPLVVIDGFVGGNLSDLNPNEIASLEVLKDASSTAIYGSRGANGVILVTTKKGNIGKKAVVEYNGYVNVAQLAKKIDLLPAWQYATTINEQRLEMGGRSVFTSDQIADFKASGGTDWQDEVYRKALQQSHQVSVSGGSTSNSYYVSANLVEMPGIVINSNMRRMSFRSNVETTLTKRAKGGINIFLSTTEDHPVNVGNQDSGVASAALLFPPTLPVYIGPGLYSQPVPGYGPVTVYNPVATALEPIMDNNSVRGEINTFLSYDIAKGLSVKTIFGTTLNDSDNRSYTNTKIRNGIGQNSASIFAGRNWLLQSTTQLNFTRKFADVHDISATLAFEYQKETSNSVGAGASIFSSDAMTYNNLGLGSTITAPSSGYSRKDILSYLGRLTYNYKDRYLLSVNGRYDGASVFGDNKWGFFPSAALAWRINNETFMQQFTAISNLKLRVSYGITGSQAVGPYSSLSRMSTNARYAIGSSFSQVGVGLNSMANPFLQWEKTGQFNVGVDLGLYRGRITLTADYYNKITYDLLMGVPQPRITGYGSLTQNIGEVQNHGVEFDLGGSPLVGKFSWQTDFNFAVNRNKVLKLAGTNETSWGGQIYPNFGNTVFLTVGQPIGQLKGYIQEGVWGTAEAAEAAKFKTIPGAPKYRDVNLDGKIDQKDITYMGNTFPKFTFGFSNTLSYKSFDLNFLFQGSYGNDKYNLTRIRIERQSSDSDVTSATILNRWSETNQNTNIPSFRGSTSYEQVQSSRWLEDGSYIRLKNVTFGYTLPSSLVSRINLSSCRIYFSGVNLLTFTKYTGYDPESATGGVDVSGGIDLSPYPSAKSYTFGINLKF